MKEFSPLPFSFLSSSLASSYPPFSLLSSHFFLHSFSLHFHSPSHFSSLFLHSSSPALISFFLRSSPLFFFSYFHFTSPLCTPFHLILSSPLFSSPLLSCLPLFSPFHPPLPFTSPLFPSFPSFFSPQLCPNPSPFPPLLSLPYPLIFFPFSTPPSTLRSSFFFVSRAGLLTKQAPETKF